MTDRNTPDPTQADQTLTKELAALRTEVARLNRHKIVTMHDRPLKILGFQLLRGIAMGFGTVVGATIVVSIAAFLLAQIDFIPIIGEWASQIASQIDVSPPQ
jgi:hypothetical protein